MIHSQGHTIRHEDGSLAVEPPAVRQACRHPSLVFNNMMGPRGMWCCQACDLRLDAMTVVMSMGDYFRKPRMTNDGNVLADECQMLKDGNHILLIENAQLRRQLEDVQRKLAKK